MGECNICTEKYNLTTRRLVKCNFCDFETCRSCVSTYICDLPGPAECMNCKKTWDRSYLYDHMGSYFLQGKYKESREKHLFEKEVSLLPATQTKVDRILYERKIKNKILQLKLNALEIKKQLSEFYVVDEETKRAQLQLKLDWFMIEQKIDWKNYKLHNGQREKKSTGYVKKCSTKDCRGFLNNHWKCTLCEKSFCKDCHEEKMKDQAHECDKNLVETIKLLKSDSKPCPSCYTMIFKIDGCDQMFCTACNTAFSWRTGSVVTGRIHNPHYYEFLRNRNVAVREIGDQPCGGILPYNQLRKIPTQYQTFIYGAHRLYHHIQDVYLPTLQPKNTETYRVEYLLGNISEYDFKQAIHRNEKANSKKFEFRLVFSMFCEVVVDLFRNYANSDWSQLHLELLNLVEYTNQQSSKIGTVFGCKAPLISSEMHLH